MIASPLAATAVTAILRCDFYAAKLECSRPSLKFVKRILLFSLSRPGHCEDNHTKSMRNSLKVPNGE